MKRPMTRCLLALAALLWAAPAGAEWAPHGVLPGETVTYQARTRVTSLLLTDGGPATSSNANNVTYLFVRFEDSVADICQNAGGNTNPITASGGERDGNWVLVGEPRLPWVRPMYARLLDLKASGAEVTVIITRNCLLRAFYD